MATARVTPLELAAAGARTNHTVGIPEAKKVAVYYFHNTIRCATCMRMEEYSEWAIQAGFPDELKSGWIEWRVVNMQLPENRHFVEDFQLHLSSLVIVRFKDGKQVEWRNLEKIWDHVGDLDGFRGVRSEQCEGVPEGGLKRPLSRRLGRCAALRCGVLPARARLHAVRTRMPPEGSSRMLVSPRRLTLQIAREEMPPADHDLRPFCRLPGESAH